MSNLRNFHQSNLDRHLFALSLESSDAASLQAQLLTTLRRIILSNREHAGARLPASRVLATELSVSRTTVQAAYDQLVSEGYLEGRPGSGTFVSQDIPHMGPTRQRHAPTKPPIARWRPFQIGLPDHSLLPHQQWARQLERAWRAPEPDLLARSDPLGWYPLRTAISEHLDAWRELSCDPEQIVITSGASESFQLIFRALLARETTVAVEDPCWPKLRAALTQAGMKPHSIAIDDEGIDPAKIPRSARAAVVTPSRHYPTGRSLPLARRVALLEWARRIGGLIVEDDYDSEFRYRGHPLPSFAGLDELRHTIYLGSFSKLISSGIRIGYMVVPKDLLGKVRGYLDQNGSSASLVPQPALAGFMQSGEFAVHLRRMRRIYAKRQAHLVAALAPVDDLLDIRQDPAGMHLCVPLRPSFQARVSDKAICEAAARADLQVAALSSHSSQQNTPQALLLGYAAFREDVLSQSANTLIDILRSM